MHAGLGDGLECAVAEAIATGFRVGAEKGDSAFVTGQAAEPMADNKAKSGRLRHDSSYVPPSSCAPSMVATAEEGERPTGLAAKADVLHLALFRDRIGELRHRRVAMPASAANVFEQHGRTDLAAPDGLAQLLYPCKPASYKDMPSSLALRDEAAPPPIGSSRMGSFWEDFTCWRRGAVPSCDALLILRRPRSAPWYSATFEGAVHDLMIDLWATGDFLLPLAERLSLMLDEADLPLSRGALLSFTFTGLAEFDSEVRAMRAWSAGLAALGLAGPQALIKGAVTHRRLFFLAETLND